ncbi:MAG: prolyl oligopeptidase family serine peptidase [Muribaculaceae bacterium]|nr:prolyl oligopeptidase family serine peptidase [Muribaculaceae bacterium]
MSIPASASGPLAPASYPEAPADNTTDIYFGTEVADPFRPLENDTAAATLGWVEAENAVTRAYLDAIPFRTELRDRLAVLNNYNKRGLPSRENDGKYYFSVNDGLRNQAVVYRSTLPDGSDAEVFLDPNTLSDDGTVALTGLFQSADGRYTAYTISRSGSDWTEIFVLDTATGALLPDHIEWAKFTGAAWHGDGFYYSAYARPEAGKEFSMANEYHKIYYHRLGTPQEEDIVVYENPDEPLHFHTADVTSGEGYLVVTGSGAGNGNALYVKNLMTPGSPFVTIEPSQEQIIEVVEALPNGNLLVYTGIDAPNYRLVEIDPAAPDREHWKEIVAERPDAVLKNVTPSQNRLLLVYDKDAANRLYIADAADGGNMQEIALPAPGTVAVSASRKYPEVFYSFTSFVHPTSIYIYDKSENKSEALYTPAPDGFDPSRYTTEQVFYTSADGTRVPMFITYRSDLKPDGTNPVYLYGYGGFNIALGPSFNPNRLLWLENGGIYAQANLRGGSEYGEAWHEAGTKQQKLNVFNDFIAAAEWLIANGWTTPQLLTIEGGSNGGLLVGACTNMRPDLFAVAIPRVGVMDMMRYHLFTIGWNWAHDYGTSADSPEMAAYLLSYSPLHNIRTDGTPYPAIMVTTADHDDRVVPAHSFKYAATLQAANTGSAPKLIRIDSKAGHGAGKPIAKVMDEWADIYSFIFHNLGISPASR